MQLSYTFFLALLTAASAEGINVIAAADTVAAHAAVDEDPDAFIRGFGPLYKLFLSCRNSQSLPLWHASYAKYMHGSLAFCSLVNSGLSPGLPLDPLPLP